MHTQLRKDGCESAVDSTLAADQSVPEENADEENANVPTGKSNSNQIPQYLCLHVHGGFAIKFFPLLNSELANVILFLQKATVLCLLPHLWVMSCVE
eukprot:SAG31_NODE_1530_length_7993_cov_7.079807_8_plen_97_part_00